MLVAQRPLFKLRTVNVLLVHPTDDKCHESLLSGIFPILSYSVLAFHLHYIPRTGWQRRGSLLNGNNE